VHTTVDSSNRIVLPKDFSDHIPWMTGEVSLAWLFLVAPGRYRLLSDEEVQGNSHLQPVRMVVLDGKVETTTEPTYREALKDAALVARLVPVTVAHPKPGWRISLPRELDAFVPPDCNPKKISILLSLEGYWEVWYTDVLRDAVFQT